jgi:hypothetical protein
MTDEELRVVIASLATKADLREECERLNFRSRDVSVES